ncbi:MAG: prenyltransferase [Candidatus Pacebacteria bacterium]|nr:prenyltransferase [Candidatus Paceibacterota bacterium]
MSTVAFSSERFSLRVLSRALRLPFTAASVLPYIAGAFAAESAFRAYVFLLGLVTVAATHLSANLINDWADTASGADWQDTTYYDGFFGGSKLIQEGRLSSTFYVGFAILLAAAAILCVLLISIVVTPAVFPAYVLVLALAWAYSSPPLQLAYRRLGEFIIFLLFGPASVIAGFYLQTGRLWSADALFLALPFGFLTTAILVANEVPDFHDDAAAGKRNLVSLSGHANAYILYAFLLGAGLVSLVLGILYGPLTSWSLLALLSIVPGGMATVVLRSHYENKQKLLMASKASIAAQFIIGVVLVVDCYVHKAPVLNTLG